ncbi:MAG: hypothetical protein QOH52_3912 [Pseudonocardiales bacterium]|nr:hypothetical protein [Pseudonocardiales bacterium]
MRARSSKAWEIAAESLGLAVTPRVRPNPALWLWYAYWGPLPRRHAIWVLYDTTCSSWVARHLARLVAAAALPVALIAIFLPAPPQLRALTAFVAGACALLFTAPWINESTEHRLVQAGYDWRSGPALRAKRDEIAQRLRNW